MLAVTREPFSTEKASPKILNTLLSLRKQGYSKSSLKFVSKALKFLSNHCNLDNPENVKLFIARYDSASSYKRNLCYAYNHYLSYVGLSWTSPKYHASNKLPKIPIEEKLNMLISASYPSLALKLSISKETGLRPIELCRLRVKDVDLEQGIIYPQTAKGGSGRALKIRAKTLRMLNSYISKHNLSLNDKLFKGDSDYYSKKFRYVRNRLAKKLNDPSIKSIRLYDLRHFFATMLYHRTKDILFVKQQMGHRKIETTLVYTQFLDMKDEEFTVRTAKTVKEASELIESGFEFVNEIDGTALYRKRK